MLVIILSCGDDEPLSLGDATRGLELRASGVITSGSECLACPLTGQRTGRLPAVMVKLIPGLSPPSPSPWQSCHAGQIIGDGDRGDDSLTTNTIPSPNAGLMLGRRHRRRASINPTLGEGIVNWTLSCYFMCITETPRFTGWIALTWSACKSPHLLVQKTRPI